MDFPFSMNWLGTKAGGLETHCERTGTSRGSVSHVSHDLHHTVATCICISGFKMTQLFECDCKQNVCYLACREDTIFLQITIFFQVNRNSTHKCDNLFVSTYIPQWNLLLLVSPSQPGSAKPVVSHSRLRSQAVCIDICEEDLNQCSVHRSKLAHYWDGIYTCQLVRIRKLGKQMRRN